jgi:sugar lactone lactonase YvrE
MRKSHVAPFVVSLAVLAACGGPAVETPPPPPPPPAPAPTPEPPPAATAAPTAAPTAAATAAPAGPPRPTPAVKVAAMATPESVLWDEANDRYLVSNINGTPLDADNNGFIAELSPDGKVIKDKLVAGGQNKVTLNAPKGMAIANGVLYVADIDAVRMFDPKSGAPKGEVKVAGATFLNDVAAGPDGKVYVSDSGLKAGASGFEPTGTDAVYVIEKGNKLKPLAKSPDLGRPNGLLFMDKALWVVTFGSGELYRLDDKGAKQDVVKLPKGSLDGIVKAGNDLLVSSWEGSAVYRRKPGGAFEVVIPSIKSPADIAWDSKRSRVVVPVFMENTVEAFDLK